MSRDDEDIVEVVDEIVDDLDVHRLQREAARLGIAPEELLTRAITEARVRMSDA